MSKSKEHSSPQQNTAAQPNTAENHKPESHKKTEAPSSSSRHKVEALPGNCHAVGCKAKAKQFDFCDEHFDHFKFGLIKKTGEQVSDYEKKIEHYKAYKNKQGVQKVA